MQIGNNILYKQNNYNNQNYYLENQRRRVGTGRKFSRESCGTYTEHFVRNDEAPI